MRPSAGVVGSFEIQWRYNDPGLRDAVEIHQIEAEREGKEKDREGVFTGNAGSTASPVTGYASPREEEEEKEEEEEESPIVLDKDFSSLIL